MTLFGTKALSAFLLLLSSTYAELLTQECPDYGRKRTLRSNSRAAQTTPTIINNGVVMLGVYGEGNLNVDGGVRDGHDGSTVVGLRFFRDGAWYDSTAYGCYCEGFGVSASIVGGGSFWGGANRAVGGWDFLSADPLVSDGVTANAYAKVTSGPLAVKHDFAPHPYTPYLYEVKVTLINTSTTQTLTNLRYRRTMDWDIPPTPFSECVSIFQASIPNDLEWTTDNGFASNDPNAYDPGLNFRCDAGGAPCPVYDNGPADHGANFQFLFREDKSSVIRTLAPGEEHEFSIFYGAAPTKADADVAVSYSGAEIVSYGYSAHKGCSAGADGAPGVYIFGFRYVGSDVPIFPNPLLEPSSVPSSKPSPSPTSAPTDGCKDSLITVGGLGCGWVAIDTVGRCPLCSGAICANEYCPVTCGTCP